MKDLCARIDEQDRAQRALQAEIAQLKAQLQAERDLKEEALANARANQELLHEFLAQQIVKADTPRSRSHSVGTSSKPRELKFFNGK